MAVKAVHVLYDCVIENNILNFLKSEDIERYAEFTKLKCEWKKEVRHLDTHAWPGTDSMILLILEEDKAKKFMANFRVFKENLEEQVPLMAMMVPVEEIA